MRHEATIAELAKESLAKHVIEDRGENLWWCGTPDHSSIYHFFVYVAPRTVVLFGDTGELVLRHSDYRSLSWLLGSPSMDYVLGKATATDGPKKEFSADLARKWLNEVIAEAREHGWDAERYEKTLEELGEVEYDHWTEDQRAFHIACRDNEIDDPPPCEEWSSQMLWQWHCLQTFVRLWWERDDRYAADCAAICAL